MDCSRPPPQCKISKLNHDNFLKLFGLWSYTPLSIKSSKLKQKSAQQVWTQVHPPKFSNSSRKVSEKAWIWVNPPLWTMSKKKLIFYHMASLKNAIFSTHKKSLETPQKGQNYYKSIETNRDHISPLKLQIYTPTFLTSLISLSLEEW